MAGVEWVYPRSSAAERCQEPGEKSEACAANTALLPGDSFTMYSSIQGTCKEDHEVIYDLASLAAVQVVLGSEVRTGMIAEPPRQRRRLFGFPSRIRGADPFNGT